MNKDKELKAALKRIAALERMVLELQARPLQQIHYYYTPPPLLPMPAMPDTYPWIMPIVTCGAGNAN